MQGFFGDPLPSPLTTNHSKPHPTVIHTANRCMLCHCAMLLLCPHRSLIFAARAFRSLTKMVGPLVGLAEKRTLSSSRPPHLPPPIPPGRFTPHGHRRPAPTVHCQGTATINGSWYVSGCNFLLSAPRMRPVPSGLQVHPAWRLSQSPADWCYCAGRVPSPPPPPRCRTGVQSRSSSSNGPPAMGSTSPSQASPGQSRRRHTLRSARAADPRSPPLSPRRALSRNPLSRHR